MANETPRVSDFVAKMSAKLITQLNDDELRWGKTWLSRPRVGQEERTRKTFNDYFDQFENGGTPVPWLKIVGNALICWIREEYPELSPNWTQNDSK